MTYCYRRDALEQSRNEMVTVQEINGTAFASLALPVSEMAILAGQAQA
ncbi:MAG: hypothetical protein WBA10_00065 [Elainellaceae cyanobacterium]